MSETSSSAPLVGRNPIPTELVEARREAAVSLRAAGLSMRSVVQEVNRLSEAKRWGTISLRTLERDIATYYRKKDVVASEERENWESMRLAHLAQVEQTIEAMALFIAEKNKTNSWLKFEKPLVLEKFFKMQMGLAELNGWNQTRSTVNTVKVTNNTVVAMYDNGTEALIAAQPKAVQGVVALLGELRSDKESIKDQLI